MAALEQTPVSPKVTAGTISGAATTIALYLLNLIPWVAAQNDVFKGAVGVIITAAMVYAVSYATKDPLRLPTEDEDTRDEALNVTNDQIDPDTL